MQNYTPTGRILEETLTHISFQPGILHAFSFATITLFRFKGYNLSPYIKAPLKSGTNLQSVFVRKKDFIDFFESETPEKKEKSIAKRRKRTEIRQKNGKNTLIFPVADAKRREKNFNLFCLYLSSKILCEAKK